MADYKATPEQWQASRERAANGSITDIRLLELRARVEALEAQAGNLKGSITSSTPPPVATDEELRDIWDRAFDLRAIYNLGIKHGQAGSREVAEPAPVAGGLVEPVAWGNFLEDGTCCGLSQHQEDIVRWVNPKPLYLEPSERLSAKGGDPAPVAGDMEKSRAMALGLMLTASQATKAGQLEDAQILRHAAAMLMERSEQEPGR